MGYNHVKSRSPFLVMKEMQIKTRSYQFLPIRQPEISRIHVSAMFQRPGHSHLVVSQNVTWYDLGEQFRIGDHSLSQSNVCILLLVCFVGISAGEVSRKQHRDVRAGSSIAPSVIAALPTRASSLLTCTSDWWDEHRRISLLGDTDGTRSWPAGQHLICPESACSSQSSSRMQAQEVWIHRGSTLP